MNNFQKDKLTKNAKFVIGRAKELSRIKTLSKINGLFLINALATKKGSLGEFILNNVLKKNNSIPNISEIKKRSTHFSIKDIVIKSFQIASISKTPYVGTEHLFHALIFFLATKEPAFLEKYFSKEVILNNNYDSEHSKFEEKGPQFINEMHTIIENFFSSDRPARNKSSLKEFGSDLNKISLEENHILIGRNQELERISNILGRKNKNNPVLIGEPGVGKTAIVEGLAQKINQGKAPCYLNNKKIINLDIGLMIAGTNFRGEFESRLKQVIKEAGANKEIILFIDEIHTLIGAGNAAGGMDAANLLKPALSRGNIQVIGATTLDEYRKNIEKDPALERRFQTIFVDEPSLEETKKILTGIKPLYEKYHNIKIDLESLDAAANLAKRYFPNKFLPDSAIDLIDESSARKRTSSANLRAHKKLLQRKNILKQISIEKEKLVITDRYEEAIVLRNKEQDLKNEIAKIKKEIKQAEKNNPVALEIQDINRTVAESAKIPLEILSEDNHKIPTRIKSALEKQIIGQNDIIKKIYQTLARRSTGISNPNKPLGSFLFIGASGIGKTLTAKILAKALSPLKDDSLVQINMSEFMEKHAISKLLGAPAGYVGYEEDKSIIEKIRQNPYSVVLFDEIEKADKNILNILLQILDEGRITDAKGREINFKNTIVILTSNLGTSELNQLSKIGFDSKSTTVTNDKKTIAKETVQKEIRKNLSIELINRLDDVLIFEYLGLKELEKITKKELEELETRLAERKIKLTFASEVSKKIAKKSVSYKQGARLIKRAIEKEIEPLIAEKIITDQPQKIKISLKDKKFIVE